MAPTAGENGLPEEWGSDAISELKEAVSSEGRSHDCTPATRTR